MSAVRSKVPDFILEQYALGELSGAELAKVESALNADASLRLRLTELRASDQAILKEAPPEAMAAAIRRGIQSGENAPRKAVKTVSTDFFVRRFPAAAAAVVLVLVGAVMTFGLLHPSVDELSRAKGGAPSLFIYKKAGPATQELRDGSAAAAGDVLQLKYGAGTARFGAVFSLDGRGVITRHLPAGGAPDTLSPRLAEGGAILPSAYELDDAPAFERFFILTSDTAFDLEAAAGALRALKTNPAVSSPAFPAGIEWKSILIRKEGGRP